ncbi:hypothetical protein ACFOHQ_15135 [Xanthomonas fragariae]
MTEAYRVRRALTRASASSPDHEGVRSCVHTRIGGAPETLPSAIDVGLRVGEDGSARFTAPAPGQ